MLSGCKTQNENGSNRRPEIQTKPNIYQQEIASLKYTYIPSHTRGDKSFEGDCELSARASLKISDDQTRLYLELYFNAKEPTRDSTEASGTDTLLIFDTKETSKKIRKILTGIVDSGQFIFGDDRGLHLIFEPYTIYAEWDMINGVPGGGGKAFKLKQKGLANFTKEFTKNGLIKRWVFGGNLNSEFDDGSQPELTIETNTISILLEEN
ncbi:hypothetical protein CRP01_31840 [Flavilitoribacter nigricans DSM 23189 = NBRC 102662]|uniref:Uncharacterized protein n=2 Tax=Flavilitoribacter TaxID=2762562 RepID=A0A2D0N350_FLAN2|nr:hypothetical protein CRP01_31840 [Flavilitoribacter nigricans DSM 23189 = NBRC 102662]